MRALWTERKATFKGKHYSIDNAPFAPKCLQKPYVHLVVGGNSPTLLRIAVKHADEWNIGLGSPGFIADKTELLDRLCKEAGRDPKSIRRSTIVNFRLEDSEAAAERARNEHLNIEKERASRGQAQKIKWVGKNETVEEALLGMTLIGRPSYLIDGVRRL